MAARIPRVATANTQKGQPRALGGAVPLDRFDGVGRTGRVKPARRCQQGAHEPSISANRTDDRARDTVID